MLSALGFISAHQGKVTEKTYTDTLWFLNYSATHPNATIWYTSSDMLLHIHSDASYLSEPRARRCAGGHYFLGDNRPDISDPPTTCPRLNDIIQSISRTMYKVMGSSAKAEIGAAYINSQEAILIRTLLLELGHPNPATPI